MPKTSAAESSLHEDGRHKIRPDEQRAFDEKFQKKTADAKSNQSAKGESGGILETLKNLQKKLKEVRLKKKSFKGNEDEKVRGFSVGGTSEESENDNNSPDKEIAMLEAEIAKQQKNLTKADINAVRKGVPDEIKALRKSGKGLVNMHPSDEEHADEEHAEEDHLMKGHVVNFASSDEAKKTATRIADLYESLGFSTSIVHKRAGDKEMITVVVSNSHESNKEVANSVNSEQEDSWVNRVGKGSTGLGVHAESWVKRVGRGGDLSSDRKKEGEEKNKGGGRLL